MGERFLFKEEEVEESIYNEHVYRYNTITPYLYGMVVDCGCGGGYGSEIIAASDKVSQVIGLDNNLDAIRYANQYHHGPKASFHLINLGLGCMDGDCVVAIEVLEHLANPELFLSLAKDRCDLMAISTPIIPTKHMNPWHLHDFTVEQVRSWFIDWEEVYFDIPDNIAVLAIYRKTNMR